MAENFRKKVLPEIEVYFDVGIHWTNEMIRAILGS